MSREEDIIFIHSFISFIHSLNEEIVIRHLLCARLHAKPRKLAISKAKWHLRGQQS